MAKISVKNELLELEFSENEAEVYQALLKTGSTSAGALIKETGFHRNVVYTALDHLIARKLVGEKEVSGVKHYTIASPDILSAEFSHKAEIAQALVESIKTKAPPGLESITIHQGNEEYLILLTSLIKQLPVGGTKYVLGTGGESFMANTMRPIWKKYHKVAQEHGITIKMIGYKPQRESFAEEIKAMGMYDVRFLPAKLENPAGIHIYPEAQTVLNILYSNDTSPVTAIKIKHPALVQGYINLFQNLWEMGKG